MSTTARRNDSPVIGPVRHNCYSGHMKIRPAMLLLLLALTMPGAGSANEMARAWEAFDGGEYAAARTIWQKLGAEGDDEAMVALAGMANTGAGQPVDRELSRRLYKAAADLGNPDAMQNLAVMLECGLGGPESHPAALIWFERAASAGRSWAARQVERIGGSEPDRESPCPKPG